VPQRVLHEPQLALSVRLLMQAPLHSMLPVGQTHWLSVQDCPGAHLLPQAPQLFGSAVTARHVPLQYTVPSGHTHVPPVQVEGAPHALPQVPQLKLSLPVLTHALLQLVRGAHSRVHCPELQT